MGLFAKKRSAAALAPVLLAAGCASYQAPRPVEDVGFHNRAQTAERKNLTVSTAVLGAEESKAAFGVNLAGNHIQPVWIRVENRSEEDYYFLPVSLDPEYFSPFEAAWISRVSFGGGANERMAQDFNRKHMPFYVGPGETQTGFVFTNLDEGFKYVNIELLGDRGIERFGFLAEVPGKPFDWQKVDFKALYPPDQVRSLDREQLRAALENLACCTRDEKDARAGDPLNLVIVGNSDEVFSALARRGWDLTHSLSTAVAAKTFGSFLFGGSYRYSPVSPLFVFGRKQDMAQQKARRSIHQRNHLRLWLAPFQCDGQPVWIGQISRDVGVRLTTKAAFFNTHKIDPDVDEARDTLFQDLLLGQSLKAVGYVPGAGVAPPGAPRHNLTGDPYFTDGLRAVLFLTDKPTAADEIVWLDWEQPREPEDAAPVK